MMIEITKSGNYFTESYEWPELKPVWMIYRKGPEYYGNLGIASGVSIWQPNYCRIIEENHASSD